MHNTDDSPSQLRWIAFRRIHPTALVWITTFVFGALVFANPVQAALTVNSATLNGGTSITVSGGATISVAVSETNTGGSNWMSTRFRTTNITTNVQITTCVDTPDHNGNGTYSETFNITAPATAGTYDVGVRAYSDNTCGGGGGANSSTVTLASGIIVYTVPTATTNAASSLTTTGATLNGSVSSNGASTTVTFDYGTTIAYGSTATATASPLAANAVATGVPAAVTGLTCNTTYHFRVNGVNSAGTTNGSDLTFTTSACPTLPTAITSAATSVVATGATLNGTVSSNGASTTVIFDYGLTTAYGSSATATQSPLATGASGSAVSAAVSSLTCNTTYHFRVNGTNSVGTTNGSDLTFTTSACPTPVTVTTATGGSAIASNTAPGCGAAGTWTTLTSPVIAEANVGDIGLGDIVLAAPTGFQFNTAATVTILLTGNGTASRNINNVATGTSMAITSITATAITFTVTAVSTRTNTLTWQGIQVRPTTYTPLANGNITHTGTSIITGVTTSTNFGTLAEAASSPVCYPATTLADGTNPVNVTLAPSAAITDLDVFTLSTSSGSDSVTALTVTLTGTNSFESLSEVRITSSDGATTYFSAVANPTSNAISFSGGTPIPVTTTPTTFKVRITPKTHANMPVPSGLSYDVGGTVTAFTSTNTQSGTDDASATVTIDNLSPVGATATTGAACNTGVTLSWITSVSSDFATTSGSVVYRWAGTAGSQVPVEGSTATVGGTNGTATLACVVSSAASTALVRTNGTGGSADCTTTALTNGQAYTYKVFQKDSNGNYDTGVTIGTYTPSSSSGVSATLSTVVTDSGNVVSDGLTPATITVTLKTCSGTPVSGKVVTLAANMGSSVITTVSGTTNASGVATFQVRDATIEGPITYTATDTTDSIVITQTVQVEFLVCFSDNFDRVSLLSTSNWTRTKSGGTTYDADIVNNRLRLTDANTNEATAVHLRRLFPGFGNKVEAMFDYFSYNGTGADGVAVTLSDGAIAPVAGAYGGSLGYAQRTGIDGFNGGWMGVGLDEYGNYSNPTEGRVGGTGFFPDNLTIRGSGSGQSGYNYHTRAAVPGGVDSPGAVAGPGYRYKITVDHSDSIHAKTTVLRDTNGDGIYEQTIIPEYDAKAIPTQATVPTYWNFSFTGSTGASTNIHEIDNLTICTVNPIVTPVLNHVRIIHDGSALTCAPETITIKACATADCQALYTGPVTVDLGAISGATWSSDPVTFSGGQVLVTLSYASTGAVTLGGSVTAPSSMTAVCYNGSTSGSCSLTYSSNACAFDAVETGKNPSTPIFTKLAGTPFTVDVLALTAGAINTGFTGSVAVDLVDQTGVTAGSCGSTSLASPTSPASPYTFVLGNSGRKTFTFNYANAAKDVRVRMVSGGITACSSDNFAIRPTSFSVTSPNANNTGTAGTPIIKAGAAFELDAASVNYYTGTAMINNNRVVAHSGAVQSGTVGGTFSAATLASSWVSKGTAFTYSEVGNFHFMPWGVYDDGSFVDVDRSKSTPECVVDNKLGTIVDPTDPNVIDLNGKYGCYFGGTNTVGGTITSPYFGRFTPDHFSITAGTTSAACTTHPAASGGYIPTDFTYFGQDGFTTVFTLTAQNASNGTTANYTGVGSSSSWAKLPLTTWGAAPASAAVPGFGFAASTWSPSQPTGAAIAASSTSPTATNSNTWVSGSTTVTAKHQISRPTSPAAPTTVNVTALPVDSDGVTMSTASILLTATPLRYGLLSLKNASGPETQALTIPVEAQYWNGSSYIVNTDDSCTSFPATSIIMNYYTPNLNACETYFSSAAATLTMAAGVFNPALSLTAPGAGNTGSVGLTLNIGSSASGNTCTSATEASATATNMPWFGTNPTATATFGSATGSRNFIYIREFYQ
ncbi:MAG TPA: DUF6701 domain-containing protein [Methylobacter sp.]|jgi:MSHA biogenesis protein MshQ